jgi:REP element-mobilizing transposase RayT
MRTAAAYGFELIAYCLMPDHLHALAEGTRHDSNFLKALKGPRYGKGRATLTPCKAALLGPPF